MDRVESIRAKYRELPAAISASQQALAGAVASVPGLVGITLSLYALFEVLHVVPVDVQVLLDELDAARLENTRWREASRDMAQ